MIISFYNVLRQLSATVVVVLTLLAGSLLGLHQSALAGEKFWTDPATGFALGGYDVVSYWSPTGPVLGMDEFEVHIENVTWRFSNQGNYEEFLKHFNIYMPQFSGYGAYAVSQGTAPLGNPNIWVIEDNKLYFFFSPNAKKKWQQKKNEFIPQAIKQWPALKRQIALAS